MRMQISLVYRNAHTQKRESQKFTFSISHLPQDHKRIVERHMSYGGLAEPKPYRSRNQKTPWPQ